MSWARTTSAAAAGEVLRGEPPVVGDDDALGRVAALDDVMGDAVGAAPDGIEGELVGDPGPPAIGAEDDRGRGRRPAGSGQCQPPGSAHRSMSAWSRSRSPAAPRSTAIGCTAVMLPPSSGAMTPSRPSTRRTTRSSAATSTVSPGWTTIPSPWAPIAPSSCVHEPEIGPADVHRAHHDLPVAGGTLHHGVVDRDRLELLVGVLQERRCGDRRLDELDEAGEPLELAADRPSTPQEDPGVPGDALRGLQLLGAGELRLLLEGGERVGPQTVDRLAGARVAGAGSRIPSPVG